MGQFDGEPPAFGFEGFEPIGKGNVLGEHDEFIPARAPDDVRGAERRAQGRRHRLDHRVPEQVPERIVCVFELVEIHNDERVVPPLLQLKGNKVFRSDLVVDLREQIRACFVAEAVFLELVVDVRELPDEFDGAPGFVTDAAEAD